MADDEAAASAANDDLATLRIFRVDREIGWVLHRTAPSLSAGTPRDIVNDSTEEQHGGYCAMHRKM